MMLLSSPVHIHVLMRRYPALDSRHKFGENSDEFGASLELISFIVLTDFGFPYEMLIVSSLRRHFNNGGKRTTFNEIKTGYVVLSLLRKDP